VNAELISHGLQAESQSWWALYEVYLQSPIWAEKRRRVFERARGLCEGCGIRRPNRIHHLRYPKGSSPGSDEWLRAEKLFDLVALCDSCHADLHPGKEFSKLH
jgi:5-methylcytosine-specific restriction endonuclease McrA